MRRGESADGQQERFVAGRGQGLNFKLGWNRRRRILWRKRTGLAERRQKNQARGSIDRLKPDIEFHSGPADCDYRPHWKLRGLWAISGAGLACDHVVRAIAVR